MQALRGFDSKTALLERFASGRNVLHLGAVGDTDSDTEHRVAKAPTSVHARLTEAAAACIGVDYDEPAVTLLAERGIFDNIVCADVTTMRREDIPLDRIDIIVVGDTIEHLSNPGDLLDTLFGFLDPQTRVVLTTPNALALGLFLRHTRGLPIEGADHVVSFNLSSLGNLLRRHGWTVEEAWTCYQAHAEERGGVGFRLGRKLLQRFPRWGGTLFVVVRPNEVTDGRSPEEEAPARRSG